MQVTWIDHDGTRRTLEVERPWAEAAARVFQSDYGFREVRVGGEPPGGPAKPHHRRLFEFWEKGLHLPDPQPQEGGPDGP
jgi:hypothetical protein